MPENAAPQHVLTEREHAQLASELVCKADAVERQAEAGQPSRAYETLMRAARHRDAATAHALTAIALELTDRTTSLAFGGQTFASDG